MCTTTTMPEEAKAVRKSNMQYTDNTTTITEPEEANAVCNSNTQYTDVVHTECFDSQI